MCLSDANPVSLQIQKRTLQFITFLWFQIIFTTKKIEKGLLCRDCRDLSCITLEWTASVYTFRQKSLFAFKISPINILITNNFIYPSRHKFTTTMKSNPTVSFHDSNISISYKKQNGGTRLNLHRRSLVR